MGRLCALLWLFLGTLHFLTACDLVYLQGSIASCTDVNGTGISNTVGLVSSGSNCIVEYETELQQFRCDGERWHFVQSKVHARPRTAGHQRHKRGWLRKVFHAIGNFIGGVVRGVVCIITLFSCLWAGRSGPPPDVSPPELHCGPPISAFAEPYQTYARVSWQEPTAHDEKDGNVRVIREGRAPGRHFPEGVSTITYHARDRSGNRARCTKDITVVEERKYCFFNQQLRPSGTATTTCQVKRCQMPHHISDGYYICHPSTDVVLGGSCRFGCYDGFDLVGESSITCIGDRNYSAAQPWCKAWACPQVSPILGAGLPSCSNETRFRSICTYNCQTGFDMPPRVSKTMVCSIHKTWRHMGTPKCIDVEPPEIQSCPKSMVFGTNRGVNTSAVYWREPTVSDNSGPGVKPTLVSQYPPDSKLLAGTYDVKYTAEDKAKNRAKPCEFKIIVRDMRCPKLYPTPYVRMLCPDGYRTGAGCNITCDPGKTLKGSQFVTCEESDHSMYGYWNWKQQQQTVCISTSHCEAIPAPSNGAVVCDNWSGGNFCQLQCRNGTEMTGSNWKRLYACDLEGDWRPKPNIRPCQKVRRPRPVNRMTVNYYFNGDCTNDDTKSAIGRNFVQSLANSLFKEELCSSVDECNKENVVIRCGLSTRTKRDLEDMVTDRKMSLSINFNVPVPLDSASTDGYDKETMKKLIDRTSQHCRDNTTITHIFGPVPVSFADIINHGLDVVCEDGHVKLDNSLSCVECPAGTYFSRSTRTCTSCSTGTYQDRSGQMTCRRCPYETTTRAIGSTSTGDCQDACLPGTISTDGVVPCSPCEIGQYQTLYGQTKCRFCKGSTTTLTTGAAHRSQCKEFDIQFSDTGHSRCLLSLAEPQTFLDFVLSFWIKHGADIRTAGHTKGLEVAFYDSDNNTVWQMHNLEYVQRGDQLQSHFHLDIPDERWHNVKLVSRNCVMTGYLDGIQVDSERNATTGRCKPIVISSIVLEAGEDFETSVSQMNIWTGTGSSFIPSPSRCFADTGSPALSWQEFGQADITNGYVHLPSLCDDHDNCLSSPCMNGNCTDILYGFHCDCERGFTGDHCQINIDDCETNICMNGATCIDGVNDYHCECVVSFTGTYCEIQMVDGQWSEWGNWTECSRTCGQGLLSRQRLCNNPHPDNGGQYCQGEAEDFVECNNTLCPVCPYLDAPGNGTITCQNISGSINCTIECDDGFDFDIQPLDNYYCGPETMFEWNVQNDDNPEGRLPKCSAIQMPEKLTVHYAVHYRDLFCASDYMRKEVSITVETRIQSIVNALPCIAEETCILDNLKVTDCRADRIQRREAIYAATAGVALTISIEPDSESANDTMEKLQGAFTQLHQSAENGSFTVDILGDEYELDTNSTSLSGDAKCFTGATRVNYYCVPCGRGSRAYDDYCIPCERGSYQDTEGNVDCMPCPTGTTTVGIGSTDVQDCAVSMDIVQQAVKVTSIVIGCVCAVVIVSVLVLIYRRYRSVKNKELITPTDIDLANSPSSEKYLAWLGSRKPVFSLPQKENIPPADTRASGLPSIED